MSPRTKHHSQDSRLADDAYTVIISAFFVESLPPPSHIVVRYQLSASILQLRLVIASAEHLQLRLPDAEVLDISWVSRRCSSVVQAGTPRRPQGALPKPGLEGRSSLCSSKEACMLFHKAN
jgi:hypothetical protein